MICSWAGANERKRRREYHVVSPIQTAQNSKKSAHPSVSPGVPELGYLQEMDRTTSNSERPRIAHRGDLVSRDLSGRAIKEVKE